MSADQNIRVVYVEDEPAIAELLRSGLGLFGIEVRPIYGNAEDAFTQLTGDDKEIASTHLFIFDIRLPGMTGMELATRLRESGETRPILIVSAYQPPTRTELEQIKAAFMPKPFDFAGIVNTIQDMLGS
jgi:two-component system response regulator MprA